MPRLEWYEEILTKLCAEVVAHYGPQPCPSRCSGSVGRGTPLRLRHDGRRFGGAGDAVTLYPVYASIKDGG